MAGFAKEGVAFTVLDQSIDTHTLACNLIFGMLSAFAEFKLSLTAERQIIGIKAAEAKGIKFGRTATIGPLDVVETHKEYGTLGKTAKALGISKRTVHRLLKAAA